MAERAEQRHQHLPAEIGRTQTAKTEAAKTIVDLHHQQRRLEDLIADHDRPLRRHRHQSELTSARHHLADIPYRLETAQKSLTAADETLAQLQSTASEASVTLARRSDIEADIAELDHRLDSDLRVRSRVTRREQPEPIVAILGPRPEPGRDARSWDTAAGRLAQHLAAFDLHSGLEMPGPDAPLVRRLDYDSVIELSTPLAQPVDRTIPIPDLGLSR